MNFRPYNSKEKVRKPFGRRKKVCPLCVQGIGEVDYKNVQLLRKFISERGRIAHRKAFGTSPAHQRSLSRAIKRARFMALLPYSSFKKP